MHWLILLFCHRVLIVGESISSNNFQGVLPSGTKLDDLLSKANETLCSVYSELPIYDRIIPVLLKEGIDKLSDACHLTPGSPIVIEY